MSTTAREPRIEPSRGFTLVPISLSGVVVGFVVRRATDFRAHAQPDYFNTCAVISGTVFVVLLGLIAVLSSHLDPERARPYFTQLFFALLAQVLIVVGLCLFAVGAGRSSTFLVLATAITLGVQLVFAVMFTFVAGIPGLVARPEEVDPSVQRAAPKRGRLTRCAQVRRARRRLIRVAEIALRNSAVVPSADRLVLRRLHDDLIRLVVKSDL